MNDADYKVSFKFTGTIDEITLTIDRPRLSPEDEKPLMEASKAKAATE